MMMTKSFESVTLLMILADVLGSILEEWIAVEFSLDSILFRFLFLTMLFTNERHFSVSCINRSRSFTESSVTSLMSIHSTRGFRSFFPFILHYIFLRTIYLIINSIMSLLEFFHTQKLLCNKFI